MMRERRTADGRIERPLQPSDAAESRTECFEIADADAGRLLFAGDTCSPLRWPQDLPGGDSATLARSIKERLYTHDLDRDPGSRPDDIARR